jgi:hypothetical protein
VIDHQLGDDTELAPVRLTDELLEVGAGAVGRMHVVVVGNIVSVVAQRRGVEG